MRDSGDSRWAVPFFFAIVFGTILVSDTVLGQAVGHVYAWEELTPAVTTKSEVEKSLGAPIFEKGEMSIYAGSLGRITVWYFGEGRSETQEKCTWQVSPNVVYEYNVNLVHPIPLPELRYDIDRYQATANDDGRRIYTDQKAGMSFATEEGEKGEVVVILKYGPSVKSWIEKCRRIK